MCGIAGVISWKNDDNTETVKKMTDLMLHRGPDSFGIRQLKGACFGHRRLSIVDLSVNGHQPMSDSTGRYWITFNGEIYGFKFLKEELRKMGVSFSSYSDTEVLIEGFKLWGIEELCKRINGMFAFGIWDNQKQLLYLARDRFGEKPLYYTRIDNKFRFASYSKSLYVGATVKPQLSPDGIVSFLHQSFCSQDTSIIEGLEKVKPAHYCIISEDEEFHKSYWQPDWAKRDYTPKEWFTRVENKLIKIVEDELVADVPTGALLSGGVDSSLIASIAAGINPNINLFTVQMDNKKLDESLIAKSFVKAINAKNHHIIKAEPINIEEFQQLISQFSEPLGDSSSIAMWIVSKIARKYTTVVLTGDGGDELFAGYNSIKLSMQVDKYRNYLNNSFGKALHTILNKKWQKTSQSPLIRKIGTFVDLASSSAENRHIRRSFFTDQQSYSIVGERLSKAMNTRSYINNLHTIINEANASNRFDRLMHLDLKNALLNDYIPKVDVASMYHSLEARAPMLHHELADIAFSIPLDIKRYGNTSKGILKQILINRIGYENAKPIVTGKRGFVLPVDSWFDNEWKAEVDRLPSSILVKEGWLDENGVKKLLHLYTKYPTMYSRLRYNLIVLNSWYNSFLQL